MKRRKTETLLVCTAVISFFTIAGSVTLFGSLAYQTDSGMLLNEMTVGHNSSSIDEAFPEQSVIPGKDADLKKTVWICNAEEKNNVPCYVRARVHYSSSDTGIYRMEGTDPAWWQGDDGYFYYTEKVPVGGKTRPLMTGIHISADESGGQQEGHLEILVYEESCQAQNPETRRDFSWQEAWSCLLGREVK